MTGRSRREKNSFFYGLHRRRALVIVQANGGVISKRKVINMFSAIFMINYCIHLVISPVSNCILD